MVLRGVFMPRIWKGALQIRFEIPEFLYYHTRPQLRTYRWRKATSLPYNDFFEAPILSEGERLSERDAGRFLQDHRKEEKVHEELRNALASTL
jgi:hypothetical protein